jgi:ABC transporter, putative
MKYVWSALGLVMIGKPVITGKKFGKEDDIGVLEISERTQYMTTAKNILIAGGDAAERLISSYKEARD